MKVNIESDEPLTFLDSAIGLGDPDNGGGGANQNEKHNAEQLLWKWCKISSINRISVRFCCFHSAPTPRHPPVSWYGREGRSSEPSLGRVEGIDAQQSVDQRVDQ